MPGVVEQYVAKLKAEEQKKSFDASGIAKDRDALSYRQEGYKDTQQRLTEKLDVYTKSTPGLNTQPVREIAQYVAVSESWDIKNGNYKTPTDEGYKDYNTGSRLAIRDWSHEHNVALRREGAEENYRAKALEAWYEKLASMMRPVFVHPNDERRYEEDSRHIQAELERWRQYNGKAPPSADQQREGAKTVAPVFLAPGSQPQTDLPRKESSMAITAQGKDVPAERREIDVASVSIPELKEYRQQLEDRYREIARERDPSNYAQVIGRVTMTTVALSDREAGRPVNAADRDAMMLTATKEALASWHETQAQQQQLKPASQLSKPDIVTEVKELHAQFKHLSEEYKQTPTPQLREEMKPVVARENELRQEYMGRAAQELSRDRLPAEVGYSR